ncbi:MAG: DUF937 domain-containing protein [Rhizobiales bacterium]|nr:DUF937 domain-containing protein [Hyphomicrobiales bacterium]
MGLFDDAVPGGNISKPLLIALGALLAGKLLSGGGHAAEEAAPQTPADPGPARQPSGADGGILGGLGDLLDRLRQNGHDQVADSWVKPGQNADLHPADLGKAIGQTTLSEIASRTGMSEEDLLRQLSAVLPGLVDKLTPDGRVPSNAEVASRIGTNPW